MNLSKLILKLFGWKVEINVKIQPKNIICVAPHTSNWDFILGELAIRSEHVKSGFLMKEAWFFFPLGYLFRLIGGIPVPKKKGSSLSDAIIQKFNSSSEMTIAITPEGTRKLNKNWRTGFLYIAQEANIPIQLAYIDYSLREIGIAKTFFTTGNIEKDIRDIKDFYKNCSAKYPKKFSTED